MWPNPQSVASNYRPDTAQKKKLSIKDFFSKCDQIRSFLRIWSHLLKKSLMKNFIFCAVIFCCIFIGSHMKPSKPKSLFLYVECFQNEMQASKIERQIRFLLPSLLICRHFPAFIVNFEHISQDVLVFLLFTLNIYSSLSVTWLFITRTSP